MSGPADKTDEGRGLESKYLRLNDLHWLRDHFFSSRRVVEGHYAGRHTSRTGGHSVEFNDYRQYMPGDEVGDIDWKVYGRTNRMYIKLFEHQSDMSINLMMDCSASMGYSGLDGDYSKYDHACMIAAAVGFLTTKQQDKISLTLAQEGVKEFHRPRGAIRHLCEILRSMENAKPDRRAKLPEALRKQSSLIKRKGLLILFSDLLDDLDAIFDSLSIFTHRGSEVILFHILHEDELKLPRLDDTVFVDSETRRHLSMNVEDIRSAYEKTLSEFMNRCSSVCKGRGIDYKLVSTGQEYTDALSDYLFQRASVM